MTPTFTDQPGLSVDLRALSEAEARQALILNASNDGLWDWEIGAGEVICNDRWYTMLGARPGDWPPTIEAWEQRVHPDDRSAWRRMLRRRSRDGKPFRSELRLRGGAGEWRWVVVSAQCVAWDVEGRPMRMVGSNRDITMRRRAEEAHAVMAQYLAYTEEVARLGYWSLDLDLGEVVWSEGLCRLLGVGPKEIDPVPETLPSLVMPEDSDRVRRAVRSLIDEGIEFDLEHCIMTPDGRELCVRHAARVRRDAAGRALHIFAVIQDMTELGLMERHLRQSQKMQSLGRMAGGVAHDFNNMLQIIMGHAAVLSREGSADASVARNAASILKASERASRLVGQLLMFSRERSRRREPVAINALVGDLRELLAQVVINHQVETRFRLGEGLPPVDVDVLEIEQVLLNLCINACDAMSDGGVLTLSTSTAPPPDDVETAALRYKGRKMQPWVAVSVTDTGDGIAKKVLPHIFEPFYTTKSVGKGTGLGLASAYAMVNRQGGRLTVSSREGRGSTFSVLLPPGNRPIPQEAPKSVSAEMPPGGCETLLLAEDEVFVRDLTRHILERSGYHVRVAIDGEQALAMFMDDPRGIDLAVLDVIMPRMNGSKVFEAMRARRSDLPVLFCTGYAGDDFAGVRGIDERCLLRKPYTASDLLKRVRSMLDAVARC